jgi:hypothetical protein
VLSASAAEVVALLRMASDLGEWKGGITELLMLTPSQVMNKVYRLANVSPAFDHHIRNGGFGSAGDPVRITQVVGAMQNGMREWTRAAINYVWEHDIPRDGQGNPMAVRVPVMWRAQLSMELERPTADLESALLRFERTWEAPPFDAPVPGDPDGKKEWRFGTELARSVWREWLEAREANGVDPYVGAATAYRSVLKSARDNELARNMQRSMAGGSRNDAANRAMRANAEAMMRAVPDGSNFRMPLQNSGSSIADLLNTDVGALLRGDKT